MKNDEKNIINILEEIALNNKSGTLEILPSKKENNKSFYLYFASGEIVFINIKPSENSKLLGQILLNYGHITEEELNNALKEQKENPEQFLGDILLERNIIDQVTLFQLFKYKIQYILFLLNTMNKKKIKFREGELPPRTPQIPYSITLKQIVNIQDKIEQNLKYFKNSNIKFEDKIVVDKSLAGSLNPEEKKIFNIIQYNNYSIVEIMNKTSIISPINFLTILNSFIERNAVEFVKPEESPKIKEATYEEEEEEEEEKSENDQFSTEVDNIFFKRILTTLEEVIPVIILLLLSYLTFINLLKDSSRLKKIVNEYSPTIVKIEQTKDILNIVKYYKGKNISGYPKKDRWNNKLIITNKQIISKGQDSELHSEDDIKINY